MPSKTYKQARFMAACAHGADYESCPPKKVAKDFNKADAKTGILKKKVNESVSPEDIEDVVHIFHSKKGKYLGHVFKQANGKFGFIHDRKMHVEGGHDSASLAMDAFIDYHKSKTNKKVSFKEWVEEINENDLYKEAQKHLTFAKRSYDWDDMEKHDSHMMDYHDKMIQYHESKGRYNIADMHAKKLSDLHKRWNIKEEVNIDFEPIIKKIAKKHSVSTETIEKQLAIGIKIEHEHTDDDSEAKKIALDHLEEKPDYYTDLKKMEAGKC